jgi:hypothetical protein
VNRHRTLFRTALAVLTLLSLILPSTSAQITPDQAVQAVRDYWKDPSIQATPKLRPEAEWRRDGWVYDVEVENHPRAGLYFVRASDGVVTGLILSRAKGGRYDSLLTRQQAREIALQFIRERCPTFFQFRWQEAPAYYFSEGPDHQFSWTRILNGYGVLAPHDLTVEVDGRDGRVVSFFRPPDRPLNCSVVPRVTAAQALQIASRYAPVDVAVLPFHDWQLQVSEDRYGMDRLLWWVCQCPDFERAQSHSYIVLVDAHSGQFCGRMMPLSQPSKSLRPVPALPAPAAVIVTGGGAKLQPSIAPVVQSGVLWVRVEALRGLGAVVQADGRGVEIVVGERRLCGSEAGAERRGLGWWVPLRRVSESLGWRVEWKPQTREAVVFTSGTQSARP